MDIDVAAPPGARFTVVAHPLGALPPKETRVRRDTILSPRRNSLTIHRRPPEGIGSWARGVTYLVS